MRPLKMTVSAFGPYAGKTEINFSKLKDPGLYLITGDTGAGKTTIFDAISYALFGEASGKVRESSMLRSKYAAPEDKTYVSLTFSYMGKTYTAERNPEYLRPSKRGGGETMQSADASLTLPDGSVISGIRDVGEKIKELLGVDKNQFSQIVMLAQGDFLKLLLSSTDERKAIFRNLFKTGLYSDLQEKLKEETSSAKSEYDKESAFLSSACDITLLRDEYKAEFYDARNLSEFDRIKDVLAKTIKKDTSESAKLKKEADGINNLLLSLAGKLSRAEDALKRDKSLESLKKEEAEIKSDLSLKSEELESAKSAFLLAEENAKEADILTLRLSDYDRLDEKNALLSERIKDEDELIKKLSALKLKINALAEKSSAIKKEQKRIADRAEEKEKTLALISETEKAIERSQALSGDLRDLISALSKLSKEQAEYKKAKELSDGLSEKYSEINSAFLDAQAGIIASSLSDGKPCPVCGSVTHPAPAHLLPFSPDESDVKKAKTAVDKARETSEEKSRGCGVLSGTVKTLTEKIRSVRSDFCAENADAVLLESDENALTLCKKLSALNDEKKLFASDGECLKELDSELSDSEEKISLVKENAVRTESEIKAAKKNISEIKKAVRELSGTLKFSSKSDAEKHIKRLTDLKNEAIETLDGKKSELEALNAKLNTVSGKIASLGEEQKDREAENLDVLEQKKAELTEKSDAVKSELDNYTVRINGNKKALAQIEKSLKKTEKIKSRWSMLKSLSDTANGTISGKEKIKLETYVQSEFFDRIIRRANLRFMIMSGGQYELIRSKTYNNKRSQLGLDLNVIDHYNGSERSVKTLSGGEAFKASLSLALGLSDEIQSMHGGTSFDTLFVDEGFGSLDSESLEKALRALYSLSESNKTVGIISHVAELREKIPNQIVVSKDKSGHSFVSIKSDFYEG